MTVGLKVAVGLSLVQWGYCAAWCMDAPVMLVSFQLMPSRVSTSRVGSALSDAIQIDAVSIESYVMLVALNSLCLFSNTYVHPHVG